jgi:RecJ-like exonuclease
LNREILEDGRNAGVIDVKQDIRLFGRHSRPLTQFLSYSTEPFLPGLTADEDACREFITSLGMPLKDGGLWRVYADLSDAERKRFVSAIYVYGKQKNIPEFILKSLVGEVYEFPKEPIRTELRDAKEFSTLLNACGRHEHADLGVAVCAGDRGEGLASARALLQKHRKMLRDGIEWAQKNGTKGMASIYILDCGRNIKDALVGVIAGMLYGAQVIGQDRPVIALAVDDNGDLKISARATWALVRRGLDLGAAMRGAAQACGGIGGGHTIAAGARVKPDMKDKFLEEADGIIGRQMEKK